MLFLQKRKNIYKLILSFTHTKGFHKVSIQWLGQKKKKERRGIINDIKIQK